MTLYTDTRRILSWDSIDINACLNVKLTIIFMHILGKQFQHNKKMLQVISRCCRRVLLCGICCTLLCVIYCTLLCVICCTLLCVICCTLHYNIVHYSVGYIIPCYTMSIIPWDVLKPAERGQLWSTCSRARATNSNREQPWREKR